MPFLQVKWLLFLYQLPIEVAQRNYQGATSLNHVSNPNRIDIKATLLYPNDKNVILELLHRVRTHMLSAYDYLSA